MTTTRKKTTIIKLKSLRESRDESDGVRILIAHSGFPYWLNVETKRWDEWWKELAPSKPLWQDFVRDEKITWNQYRKRFISEIKNNPKAIQTMKMLKSGHYEVVTLLSHCRDEKYCHRSIIKEMILKT
jgi:uncharacterized protein YeaO (DUF488 family)